MENVLFLFIGCAITLHYSHAFDWSDYPDLHRTLYVCQRENVTLPWNFTLSISESLEAVNLIFKSAFNGSETSLPVLSPGHFFQGTDLHPFQFVPGQGIILTDLRDSTSGDYTVSVDVRSTANGTMLRTYYRTVTILIPVPPQGRLEIKLLENAVKDNTTGIWHLQLSCGGLTRVGQPPVTIHWSSPTTPELNLDLSNGTSVYNIPNPVKGGDYSCRLTDDSPALRCLGKDSPLKLNRTVEVNRVDAILQLLEASQQELVSQNAALLKRVNNLESQYANLQKGLQHIETAKAFDTEKAAYIDNMVAAMEINATQLAENMTKYLHSRDSYRAMKYSGEIFQRVFPVRLNGSRASEGRVEIKIGDNWGTICSDGANAAFAKVVCNQLNLPSVHAAVKFYGQGKGIIFLDDIRCAGNETHVILCGSRPLRAEDCVHSEDVGVICQL